MHNLSMLAAARNDSIAGPVLIILFLAGSVIYLFGYARAVMHRANSDYKRTKAVLPGMRQDFWRAWWHAVKVGFLIALAFLVLVAWAFQDARNRH